MNSKIAQLKNREFEKEFKFRTSRSSGKGGQNVNKVETKVELVFNVPASKTLDDDEKILIQEKLEHKLSAKGDLRIVVETSRSQLKNKELSIGRFYEILEKALKRPKIRKPSAPSKSAIEQRKKTKRLSSEKKRFRKKIDWKGSEE